MEYMPTYLSNTIVFSGCVNGDKNQICFVDSFLNVCREEEIFITTAFDYFIKSRLKIL